MKRFYCTICERIKRVRVYPTSVKLTYGDDVRMREGQCSWHTRIRSHALTSVPSSISSNEYGAMRISIKSASSSKKGKK